MNIIKLSKEDYITTNWTGGTTTEIVIFPNDKKVSKQDFLYRISTAKVEIDSIFTIYSNYIRFITTLDNAITLNDTLILKPLEVYKFNGDESTSSKGVCNDFNLICKKGLDCNMEVMNDSGTKSFSRYNHYIIYSKFSCVLNINGFNYYMNENDSLVINESQLELSYTASSGYIIICMINV